MLKQHRVHVTRTIKIDLLHLQVQFLIAMLALDFILILTMLMIYRYMKYREYQGEIDFLTGVMGRRLFCSIAKIFKVIRGFMAIKDVFILGCGLV